MKRKTVKKPKKTKAKDVKKSREKENDKELFVDYLKNLRDKKLKTETKSSKELNEEVFSGMRRHIRRIKKIYKDDLLQDAKENGLGFVKYALGDRDPDRKKLWYPRTINVNKEPECEISEDDLLATRDFKSLKRDVEKNGLTCTLKQSRPDAQGNTRFEISIVYLK